MNQEQIDYKAVLADLKRRRDELDMAIQAIQRILGLVRGDSTSVSAPKETFTPIGSDNEIASDTFFNMSILEAVKKYLTMKKRPQGAMEIARALQDGGLINQSQNFTATVYTTLKRAYARDGSVVQVKKKW